MQPPMTAVHVAYRRMGASAADMLLDLIAGRKAPGPVLLEPSLSVRASTMPH